MSVEKISLELSKIFSQGISLLVIADFLAKTSLPDELTLHLTIFIVIMVVGSH